MDEHKAATKSWIAALIVVLVPGLNVFVGLAISPALPGLATQIGSDAGGELFAQLVMVAPAFMIASCGPFSNFLVNRWGRRNCLAVALCVFAVSGVAGMFTPNLITLVLTRLLLGAAGGFLAPLGLSVAADLPAAWRERALGVSGAMGALGALFALTVGGMLVDMAGWRAPLGFYLLALPLLLPVLMGLSGGKPDQADATATGQWKGVFVLWPFFGLMILECIGIFIVDIQGPFLLDAAGAQNASTIGMAIAGYTITGALSGFSYGWFRGRLGELRMLIIAPILLGIGLIIVSLAEEVSTLQLCFLAAGFGSGWISPALYSAVLVRSKDCNRATAMGLIYGAVYLGQFLNPIVVGSIQHFIGLRNSVLVFGIFLIGVAVVLTLVTSRSRIFVSSENDLLPTVAHK